MNEVREQNQIVIDDIFTINDLVDENILTKEQSDIILDTSKGNIKQSKRVAKLFYDVQSYYGNDMVKKLGEVFPELILSSQATTQAMSLLVSDKKSGMKKDIVVWL